MSKVLVIVYSNTGRSRKVAQLLCSQQNWPMAELTDTVPRSGLIGNLRCLLDSIFRRRPAIRYHGPHPQGFDAVMLVFPIWALRLAAPMRSFVARQGAQLSDAAVLSVMGGEGAPDADAEITQLMGRPPLLSMAVTAREVDSGSCAERLQAFGDAVGRAKEPPASVRPVTRAPQAAQVT